MSWEDTFTSWSQGPSTTEDSKCQNAESVISSILKKDNALAKLPIRVFTQGSYKARTNVRLDSDVDICVLSTHAFFHTTQSDVSPDPTAHLSAPSLGFAAYKDLVQAALVNALGSKGVTRGNKAFDVHANTYRIDADVVPAFEYRHYYSSTAWRSGVAFLTDSGTRIHNYPDQAYANGVAKHTRTGRAYKRAIRILKRLRNKMQDENIATAQDIGSFLIESLVWNAPDEAFAHNTYTKVMRAVLAHTFNGTIKDESCKDWLEVNDHKFLFHSSQPWTRPQAHGFLSAAWDYLGLK
jgi:hypothetical protein